MDLRKKATPVQILGEGILRFRLIFAVIFAILYVIFARDFSETFAYIVSASKDLSSEVTALPKTFAAGALVPVLGAALVIALFTLRIVWGKARGLASLLLSCMILGAAIAAAGALENQTWILALVLLLASMIFYFAVRSASLKALLPALLTVFFWISFAEDLELPALFAAVFGALLFADILLVSLVAAGELSKGTPVSGALLAGFSKAIFPSVLSAVLAGALFGYALDVALWKLILSPVISVLLFLLAEFSMLSFAPMKSLRAEQREMKI